MYIAASASWSIINLLLTFFLFQTPFEDATKTEEEEEKKFLQMTETTFSQAVGHKKGTINQPSLMMVLQSPCPLESTEDGAKAHMATLTQYLWSIIYMPMSLRVLCLTNLFCWMSLVCYSLYFTDFVGESVFGGDPQVEIAFISHVPEKKIFAWIG